MLNTDSALAWHEDAHGLLLLRLERGEAAVRLGTDKVVDIEAAGRHARLSSGLFDARLYPSGCEIAVLGDGVIRTAAGKIARRHEIVRLDGSELVTVAHPAELDATMAWQAGEILFRDEPLSSAIMEYNRYLRRKIVIVDPRIGAIRIGGRFTTDDPASFLDALRAGFDIDVRRTENGFALARM
ncbi:MAG: hypothetical protein EOP89_04300 [Lysobacteraceae bacterium]|nr:MAG: hypothetical protein EOP89_04300 [Xanthomonadaceae bacterium]